MPFCRHALQLDYLTDGADPVQVGRIGLFAKMSSTASKLGLVLTDTGASGSDRRTSNGDLDILGLLTGNTSLDVSKLKSTNTSIDPKELVGEGGTYTGVPGTLIAYGKTGNNGWSYRLVPASGQLAINNGVFGDPLYGVYKYAYIATSNDEESFTSKSCGQCAQRGLIGRQNTS
jgi:hypothetical protein